jgi:eukaryotic-like serine/threonine-protein kinase
MKRRGRSNIQYSDKGQDWVGQLVAQRYRIEMVVGYGTLSTVYRAIDTRRHLTVALKRLNQLGNDAIALLRFRDIAYASAHIEHPRIVPLVDYELIDDTPIVVLPWIQTPTLYTYFKGCSQVSSSFAVQLALWLADALSYLHSHHLLHLDLIPRNIFLDPTTGVRITDLGLMQAFKESNPVLTSDGSVRGLPFLAPEQITHGPVTPATDVYTVGVIIYRAITGRYPFPAETLTERLASLQKPMEWPNPLEYYSHSVPEDLNEVIFDCLNHDPAQRPANGIVLFERLARIDHKPARTTLTHIAYTTESHIFRHNKKRQSRTPENTSRW